MVVMEVINSTLQLFGAACRVYSPSDVRPVVELGDSLKQEGVVNPLPALMNSSKGKYTGQAAPKSCKVEIKVPVSRGIIFVNDPVLSQYRVVF